jgi:hypothetical protein
VAKVLIMGASDAMTDIDWFVWEPLNSAHIYNTDEADAVPMERAQFDEIVFAGSGTARIRVPVGRYAKTVFDVHVPLPCTRRDILSAIHEFYMRPVTHDHVRILRAAGADDPYLKSVVEALDADGDPRFVDFNGSTNYGISETLQLRAMDGSLLPKPALDGDARRHPLAHCTGAVRFEGLRGDDASHMYDMLLGS